MYSSNLLLLHSNDLAYSFQQILEIITILFLDFEHAYEHVSHILTKLTLDSLKFLQERIEFYLEILKIIDVIQLFTKNDFNKHYSQGKNISFERIVFRCRSTLRIPNHLLRGKVYSLSDTFLIDLLIRPALVFLTHNSPSVPVSDSCSAYTEGNTSIERHLAYSFDNIKKFVYR